MENHPIPQDVTGFQFKLVGNMTLKQFAYVGCGVVMAVIFTYAPIFWLLQLILVPLFALTGICMAFIPIEGRPMDQMLRFFITAIFKPDQYIYQKQGGELSFCELNLQPVAPQAANITAAAQNLKTQPVMQKKEKELLSYLYNSVDDTASPLDQRENQFISSLFLQPAATAATQQTISSYTAPPTPSMHPGESQPHPVAAPVLSPHEYITRPQTQPIQQAPEVTQVSIPAAPIRD